MYKLICLMPTYNKEATLTKAIESVMMQKADFDYKLIILDDCSTDNSYQIALQYKQRYPEKIDIVRNQSNLKLLRSIMYGYTLLKGAEYFCVLDADDWYTDNKKFADAVSFLDKHKKYTMYMTNIILKKGDNEEKYYNGVDNTLDFNFYDRLNGKAVFIQTSGVVYRNVYFKNGYNKQFAQILNLKFPESYRADGFRFEWYLQAGKAHFEDRITAVYNYDMNGIWSSMTEAEQALHNAKMMYSCAEFITSSKQYYLYEARQLYKKAMKDIVNISDETFIRNKELIADLSIILLEKTNSIVQKICLLGVKLIPSKKLRRRYKKLLMN